MEKSDMRNDSAVTIENLGINGFKMVERDHTIRIQDLTTPLIGVYRGKERAKHSEKYLIETETALIRVIGCTDLDMQMAKVSIGMTVAIIYEGEFITKKGNRMFKSSVMVKQSV